jgi:hypothetical protein
MPRPGGLGKTTLWRSGGVAADDSARTRLIFSCCSDGHAWLRSVTEESAWRATCFSCDGGVGGGSFAITDAANPRLLGSIDNAY